MASKEFIGINRITELLQNVKEELDKKQKQIEEVSEDVETNQAAIADMMNVYGAKNLISYPYYEDDEEDRGITYINNSDGSISIFGTSSGNSNHVIMQGRNKNQLDNNLEYILSGGLSDKVYLRLQLYLEGSVVKSFSHDKGSGTLINGLDSITYDGIQIQLFVNEGTTVNDIIYPMLTTKDAYEADPTYVPYAKTNAELTADVAQLQTSVDSTILTASSSPIEDTIEGGLRLMEMDGKTEQVTTTGKNLYTPTGTTTTTNGITFIVNDNGTVTANGTASGGNAMFTVGTVNAVTGETYTISGVPSGVSDICFMRFSGHEDKSANYDRGDGVTATTPSNRSGLQNLMIIILDGKTANNIVFEPMIQSGSTSDRVYEKATNGLPSPSPDYPQPIKCAVVDEVRSVGKNLLKNTATNQTIDGVTFTVNSDKSITITGSPTLSNGTIQYILCSVKNLLEPGHYIQSLGVSSNALLAVWLSKNSNFVKGEYINITNSNNSSYTFEITQKDIDEYPYVIIVLGVRYNIANINVTLYPMIRRADVTDDTYEPYHSTAAKLTTPIKLYGTDTVKDRIVKVDGLWKVERKYGDVVIDGDETIDVQTNASNTSQTRFRITIDDFKPNEKTVNHKSNIAVIANNNNATYCFTEDNKFAPYADGSVYLSKIADTVDSLKTFLAATPMHIVYELTTPTYETLPDADQKVLNSLKTWDGVTNLFFEHGNPFSGIGSSGAWEQGGIDSSGDVFESNIRIRTKNYYSVIQGINIYVAITGNFVYRIRFYDSKYNYISEYGWASSCDVVIPEGAYYAKFVIGGNGDFSITPSVVGSSVTISITEEILEPDWSAEYGAKKDVGYLLEALNKADNPIESSGKEFNETAKADGTSLTEIRFGIDENGNYGYYKAGADTVTPFLIINGDFAFLKEKIGDIKCNGNKTTQRLDIPGGYSMLYMYVVNIGTSTTANSPTAPTYYRGQTSFLLSAYEMVASSYYYTRSATSVPIGLNFYIIEKTRLTSVDWENGWSFGIKFNTTNTNSKCTIWGVK